MSRWVLGCVICDADFTHTEILTDDWLPDPFLPTTPKPEFPTGGLTITCPNCGAVCVYHRHQLKYRVA
jgi:hypothetical protein